MGTEDDIERAIRLRRSGIARTLVKQFVRERGGEHEARLKASEYLRRLTDYGPALRVLNPEALRAARGLDARNQMQLARILNLLGASGYALRILRSLHPEERSRASPQAVGILLSNYEYAEALPLLAPIEALELDRCDYSERLQKVNVADAWFGVGRTTDAIRLVHEIERASPEPLLKGIAHQAAAAYLLQSARVSEAKHHLEESERYFPASDTTADRGFLDKWIAAYWIEKGDAARARRALAAAWPKLYRPGIKPEGWLELVYFGGLLKWSRSRRIPSEWKRVLAYPSPVGARTRAWIAERIEVPPAFELSGPTARGAGGLCIAPAEDMRFEGRGSEQRQVLGLTLVDRFVSMLAFAGTGGVPQFRIYEGLWPHERFSFSTHQKRIEQILRRARAGGFEIESTHHHLRLRGGRSIRVRWQRDPAIVGAAFLRKHPSFVRLDVERALSLSARAAGYAIARWIDIGIVETFRRGRYEVTKASLRALNHKE